MIDQNGLIDQIGSQLPTTIVGPMLLFLYLFLVLVVLLNLLIAQMVRGEVTNRTGTPF